MAIVAVLLLAGGAGYFATTRIDWTQHSAAPTSYTTADKQQNDLAQHHAVAKLDNHYIQWKDAQFEYISVKTYYQSQQNTALKDPSKRASLAQQLIQMLANQQTIASESAKRGITVSDAEVNDQVDKITQTAGGTTKVNEVLKTYYGWTLDDLHRKIKTQLLTSKLNTAIGGSTDQGAPSLSSATSGLPPELDKLVKSDAGNSVNYYYRNSYEVISNRLETAKFPY